ncbi:ATP-binding cassette domain-containing protein [Paenibacillus albiflavus]|uniref:ATP-binding cassette domain-containing protein n=1 Tax=Paenibacillus albiflavus TaxID=2545760 RepID=A0A4V2WPD1_9BACL|nr:ABC transporter transmembrane domain-containing protein [Paenibacillus albiflavus]TCZ78862.1 ATP-binding cassette domain-containing protein [Paenibacillus albiflavus]
MFDVFVKMGWFFKQEWKRYAIAISMLMIANVFEIIPPKLMGMMIDAIQLGTLTTNVYWLYIGIGACIVFIAYGVNYTWHYNLFRGSYLVERILRSKFMSQLLRMTPTFYEKNRTGDLMARATNDLRAVSITVGFGILTLADSTMFLLTILVMMAVFISWKLTLAAFLPLPLIALAIRHYGSKIHDRFDAAQDAFGNMNDSVLESVAGVRVIRAYVQEQADQARFEEVTKDVYAKNAAVAKIDALFDPTIKVLVGCSYLIGLGYGAYLVFHNEITLGELIAFNVYLGMLIWPMFALGELINIMQRGGASLDRVNETLSYPPDVQDASHTVEVDRPETIAFHDVSFRYPSSDKENLQQVSFTLKRGETLGIVGRTGAGKTTLVKQLLREYPVPQGGEITITDQEISQIGIERLHSWIGYVPQDSMLFSKTVMENIRFGKHDATEEEVLHALELASFRQDIHVLPNGLNTLVGEKGMALSGGQKQRVSLARALMADPDILILDDAMSAVDARTEARIIDNIRRERAGRTTLIVTHRLSAVQHANHILVIDEGQIVEEGTHEELLALGGWYKEQFDRQQTEASLE